MKRGVFYKDRSASAIVGRGQRRKSASAVAQEEAWLAMKVRTRERKEVHVVMRSSLVFARDEWSTSRGRVVNSIIG